MRGGPFVTPSAVFAISGEAAVWRRLLAANPQPGDHDLLAFVKRGELRLTGNLHPLMSHLLYFKHARPYAGGSAMITSRSSVAICVSTMPGGVTAFISRRQGGDPLVCLHTAGADTRQYRGLMNAAAITERFQVIAFDLPFHGKSPPPAGWQDEEYLLTANSYAGIIMAVIGALGLERPVIMGCSIGGHVVLHLAFRHPRAFRALIGLESSAHVDPYYDTRWLHRPDVHGGEVAAGAVSGLVAPQSARGTSAGKRCGITCRAAPACSKAISTFTASMAICVASSAASTPRNARYTS